MKSSYKKWILLSSSLLMIGALSATNDAFGKDAERRAIERKKEEARKQQEIEKSKSSKVSLDDKKTPPPPPPTKKDDTDLTPPPIDDLQLGVFDNVEPSKKPVIGGRKKTPPPPPLSKKDDTDLTPPPIDDLQLGVFDNVEPPKEEHGPVVEKKPVVLDAISVKELMSMDPMKRALIPFKEEKISPEMRKQQSDQFIKSSCEIIKGPKEGMISVLMREKAPVDTLGVIINANQLDTYIQSVVPYVVLGGMKNYKYAKFEPKIRNLLLRQERVALLENLAKNEKVQKKFKSYTIALNENNIPQWMRNDELIQKGGFGEKDTSFAGVTNADVVLKVKRVGGEGTKGKTVFSVVPWEQEVTSLHPDLKCTVYERNDAGLLGFYWTTLTQVKPIDVKKLPPRTSKVSLTGEKEEVVSKESPPKALESGETKLDGFLGELQKRAKGAVKQAPKKDLEKQKQILLEEIEKLKLEKEQWLQKRKKSKLSADEEEMFVGTSMTLKKKEEELSRMK